MKFTAAILFAVASARYGGYEKTYPAEDDYGLSRGGKWDAPLTDDYNNYAGVTKPKAKESIREYAVAEDDYYGDEYGDDYGYDEYGDDYGYDDYGYDDGDVDYEGE